MPLPTSHRIDMLHGPLVTRIIAFALPIAASSLLQQLFNSVDLAVVGHFARQEALATAAVGCNSSVINLIVNLFVGVSVGANVAVSTAIGQKDEKRASSAIHSSMTVAIVSGVFLLVVTLVVARPILTLMDTPPEVLPMAVEYLRIYALGMPFIMVYNFASAILRSIGDTRRPLFCLTCAGVLNAGLNLLLVIVFHLDVAGVAIATVVSNVVSSTLVVVFLLREKGFARLEIRKLGVRRDDLSRILRIGLPAGLQSVVFSLSNVIIQSNLNGLGATVVAGSAAGANYESFAYFVVSAFCQAAVTFTSQNYAAGQYRRCNRIFRSCLACAMISSAALGWLFIWQRPFFASLFTGDAEVAVYAQTRMAITLSLYFILPTYEIGGSALRGMGYSLTPALMTVVGTCLLRIFWVFAVFPIFGTFESLLAVYPVSWSITGIAVLTSYFILRGRAYRRHHPAHQ